MKKEGRNVDDEERTSGAWLFEHLNFVRHSGSCFVLEGASPLTSPGRDCLPEEGPCEIQPVAVPILVVVAPRGSAAPDWDRGSHTRKVQ